MIPPSIKPIFCGFGLLLSTVAAAQVGGTSVFRFLNQSPSARMTGLGGAATPILTNDPSFGLSNPALLNEKMDKKAEFSHQFLFADAGAGTAAFAKNWKKYDLTWLAAVQYLTYGTFKGADVFGNLTSDFTATDVALTVGAARKLNPRLRVGANVRFLSSRLESASATGLATDIGALYFNPDRQFGAALTLKNVGIELTKFTENGSREALPFDLQASFSKKLKRAPLRFGLVLHDLHRWNLRYPTPETEQTDNLFGESATAPNKTAVFFDNLFRHTIFSTEILFGATEGFRIRLAYDHQRRREGLVTALGGSAGFSFGVGMKIKRFYLDYGSTRFHSVGGTQHLGLSVSL